MSIVTAILGMIVAAILIPLGVVAYRAGGFGYYLLSISILLVGWAIRSKLENKSK